MAFSDLSSCVLCFKKVLLDFWSEAKEIRELRDSNTADSQLASDGSPALSAFQKMMALERGLDKASLGRLRFTLNDRGFLCNIILMAESVFPMGVAGDTNGELMTHMFNHGVQWSPMETF